MGGGGAANTKSSIEAFPRLHQKELGTAIKVAGNGASVLKIEQADAAFCGGELLWSEKTLSMGADKVMTMIG